MINIHKDFIVASYREIKKLIKKSRIYLTRIIIKQKWHSNDDVFSHCEFLPNCQMKQTNKFSCFSLTLYAPVGQIRHVLPKFRFQNKKGSQKINYERRNYESVDEKILF